MVLVNCSERKNPPISRQMISTICGVPGTNSADAAKNPAAMKQLTISTRRKPHRRMIGAAVAFIAMAPAAEANVTMPEANGVMPKLS